jgi:hypothetical protein
LTECRACDFYAINIDYWRHHEKSDRGHISALHKIRKLRFRSWRGDGIGRCGLISGPIAPGSLAALRARRLKRRTIGVEAAHAPADMLRNRNRRRRAHHAARNQHLPA